MTGQYTIKTSAGQTIWDILVQEYGEIEMFTQLLNDNPGLMDNLDTQLPAGSILIITEGVTVKSQIFRDYMRGNLSNQQTKLYVNSGEKLSLTGIDYTTTVDDWVIG